MLCSLLSLLLFGVQRVPLLLTPHTIPFCSLTVVPCSYVIDRPVLSFLQAAALTSSHLIIDLCVIWKAQ